MSNLINALLANRSQEHVLIGLPIGPLPSYLAIDHLGCPNLAVPALSTGQPQIMETDYLVLRLFVEATIVGLSGEQSSGMFHVLSCKSAGPEVNRPFEILATALAETMSSARHAANELSQVFDLLCELFRIKPQPNLAGVRTGLWAELFVMQELSGFRRLAPFWHTEPERKFDFSCNSFRIEVKATTGSERSHIFSHGQLYRTDNIDIVVGSLVLQPEDAGLSLRKLIDDTRSSLGDDPVNQLKLEKAVRSADMMTPENIGPRFDPDLARNLLCFYKATDLPHFPLPEPPGVSATSYRVTIGGLTPMTLTEVDAWLQHWDDYGTTLRRPS